MLSYLCFPNHLQLHFIENELETLKWLLTQPPIITDPVLKPTATIFKLKLLSTKTEPVVPFLSKRTQWPMLISTKQSTSL